MQRGCSAAPEAVCARAKGILQAYSTSSYIRRSQTFPTADRRPDCAHSYCPHDCQGRKKDSGVPLSQPHTQPTGVFVFRLVIVVWTSDDDEIIAGINDRTRNTACALNRALPHLSVFWMAVVAVDREGGRSSFRQSDKRPALASLCPLGIWEPNIGFLMNWH